MDDPDFFEDDVEEEEAVVPLPEFEQLYSDEAASEGIARLLRQDTALAERVAYLNDCGIFGRITAAAVDSTAIYGDHFIGITLELGIKNSRLFICGS